MRARVVPTAGSTQRSHLRPALSSTAPRGRRPEALAAAPDLGARLDRASRLGFRLPGLPARTSPSPGGPANGRLQRAKIRLEGLDSRVVDVHSRLSQPVLQLIRDTPEESFASFYELSAEEQISFLGTLEVLARQLLGGAGRRGGHRALEGPSNSGDLIATSRRRQPDLRTLYEGFRELNPNFLGELLNLATGGMATIHGVTPEGLSMTLTISGGLQSLMGPGLLALTGPRQSTTVQPGASLSLLPPLTLASNVSHPLTTLLPGLSPNLSSVSGLASRLQVGRFTQAALSLHSEWSSLSAQERAQRIVAAANRELGALGIPPCGYAMVKQSSLGEFSHTTWEMDLQEGLFQQDEVSREELADLGDTVYHEARHAEQFFRIVRFLAATGKSKKEIKEETGIPGRVVALGFANPLPVPKSGYSKEMVEAMEWHESVFGKKAQSRRESLLMYREIKRETFLLELDYDQKNEDLKKRTSQVKQGGELLKKVSSVFLSVRKRFERFGQLLALTKQQFLQQQIRPEFKGTLLGLIQEKNAVLELLTECQHRVLALNQESSLEARSCQIEADSLKELKKQLVEYQSVLELFYQEYRELPEEQDAWDIGGLISQTLLSVIPELSQDEILELEIAKLISSQINEGDEIDEKTEIEEPLELDLDLNLNLEEEEDLGPHPFDGPIAEIEERLRQLLARINMGMAILTPLPPDNDDF